MSEAHTNVETPQRTETYQPHVIGIAPAQGRHDERIQRGVSTDSTHGSVLFKGRWRVASTRLPAWDYRSNGYYFVTVCTRDRTPFLGDVADGAVRLSGAGEIVAAEWRGISARRRDVALDEWIVMPNHLHGIVVIARKRGVETPQSERNTGWLPNDSPLRERPYDDAMQRGVSTGLGARLLAGSLGAIVGQFKSRVTKRAWRAGFGDFGWQPRCYDHIIRDDTSLDRIRQYIIDNPAKWDSHEGTPENLWM